MISQIPIWHDWIHLVMSIMHMLCLQGFAKTRTRLAYFAYKNLPNNHAFVTFCQYSVAWKKFTELYSPPTLSDKIVKHNIARSMFLLVIHGISDFCQELMKNWGGKTGIKGEFGVCAIIITCRGSLLREHNRLWNMCDRFKYLPILPRIWKIESLSTIQFSSEI